MIEESIPEGGNAPIPFNSRPVLKPTGHNVLIEYEKNEMVGGIIMPNKMKALDFVAVKVLDIGPDCKVVKPGDRIVIAIKAMVNGEAGVLVDNHRFYFTQEPLVVAVVSG